MTVRNQHSGSIRAALMEMSFIGDCIRHHEAAKAVATEWQYVAMVLDRLLLWVRFYFKKVAKIFSDISPRDFLWNNFYISQPFDLSRHRRLRRRGKAGEGSIKNQINETLFRKLRIWDMLTVLLYSSWTKY